MIARILQVGSILLGIAFAPVDLHGQNAAVGFSAGLTRATAFADEGSTFSITGFEIAGHFILGHASRFGLKTGATLARKGFNVESPAVNVSGGIRLTYLEIPVQGVLNLRTTANVTPFVYLGPAIAFEAKCSVVASGPGGNFSTPCGPAGVETNSIELAWTFGGGLRFPINRLNLTTEMHYSLGITDIAGGVDTIKNRALSFSIGLLFPLH